MKNNTVSLLALALVVMMCAACKVQKAPGAYVPAEGKKAEQVQLAQKEVKEEPKVEETKPEPVVETKKEEPAPVVVETPKPVEQEVTRAENFSVVEGEDAEDLKNYHVVIGSFKSQDNAKRLQASMRPDYKPIIVVNEQGMYRVLLASYDDYASAKAKIVEIRSRFSDAWVLVQKK